MAASCASVISPGSSAGRRTSSPTTCAPSGLLAWTGNAWHVVEFAIAVGAGIAAGSVALVGFGIDSMIESLAGFVILWRFADRRAHAEQSERRAQQLVAASYAILVAYIVVEAT